MTLARLLRSRDGAERGRRRVLGRALRKMAANRQGKPGVCPVCGASGDGGHGGGCPNAGVRYPGPDRGGHGLPGGSRP